MRAQKYTYTTKVHVCLKPTYTTVSAAYSLCNSMCVAYIILLLTVTILLNRTTRAISLVFWLIFRV